MTTVFVVTVLAIKRSAVITHRDESSRMYNTYALSKVQIKLHILALNPRGDTTRNYKKNRSNKWPPKKDLY